MSPLLWFSNLFYRRRRGHACIFDDSEMASNNRFTRIRARYTIKYLVYSVPWRFVLSSRFQRQSLQNTDTCPDHNQWRQLYSDCGLLLHRIWQGMELNNLFPRIRARYTIKYLVYSVPWNIALNSTFFRYVFVGSVVHAESWLNSKSFSLSGTKYSGKLTLLAHTTLQGFVSKKTFLAHTRKLHYKVPCL